MLLLPTTRRKFLAATTALIAASAWDDARAGYRYGMAPFDPSQLAGVLLWYDAGFIQGLAPGAALTTGSLVDRSQYARGALQTAGGATYQPSGGSGVLRPYIAFDGSTQYLRTPSFSVTHPRVLMVATPTEFGLNGRFFDGNTVNKAYMDMAGIPAGPQINGSATGIGRTLVTVLDSTKTCLFDCRFNGSSSSLQVDNNVTKTGNVGSAAITDGFCIGAAGNLTAGFFRGMKLWSFIVVDDDVITAPQLAALKQGLVDRFRLLTKNHVAGSGNSHIASSGGNTMLDQVNVMMGLSGGANNCLFNNQDAVGGQTTTAMIAALGSSAHAGDYAGYFRNAILVVEEMLNDIGTAGVNGAQAWANMVTVLSYWRNHGWPQGGPGKILLSLSVTPVALLSSPQNAELVIANNLARANAVVGGYADAVVDCQTQATMIPPALDGTHYDSGQQTTFKNFVFSTANSLGVPSI